MNETKTQSFKAVVITESLEKSLTDLQGVVALNDTSAVYDPISKLIGLHSGIFRSSLQPNVVYPAIPEIRELSDVRYSFGGVASIIAGFESYSKVRDKLVRRLKVKRQLARLSDRKLYWENTLVKESEKFRLLELLCQHANAGSVLAQEHYEKAICQRRGVTNAHVDYNPMLNLQLDELLKARNSVFLSPSSQSLKAYCRVALESYASPELQRAFFALEGVKQSEWDAYVSNGVAILNRLEVAVMVEALTA